MPARKPRIQQAEVVRAFAARLRELRASRGMTQGELAKAADVTVSHVWRLEAAASAPGIDLVDRLAQALGAAAADLLPASAPPPDEAAVLRERARALFESLAASADRDTLALLNAMMARLAEAPKRRA